jgi:hypothetical protein
MLALGGFQRVEQVLRLSGREVGAAQVRYDLALVFNARSAIEDIPLQDGRWLASGPCGVIPGGA